MPETDCQSEIITPELGAVAGATFAAVSTLYKLEEYEFKQEEHYLQLILDYRNALNNNQIDDFDAINIELDEIHNDITSLFMNRARKTRLLTGLETLIDEIRNRLNLPQRVPPPSVSISNFSFFSSTPASTVNVIGEVVSDDDSELDNNGTEDIVNDEAIEQAPSL